MTIKVYFRPQCPICAQLRVYLKKKKVSFEEFDVEESQNGQFRDEVLDKTGQCAVPVIDIDGQILIGFDEAKLEALLPKKEKK